MNGTMQDVREVAGLVPVYLVNAPPQVVAKYRAANGTNRVVLADAAQEIKNPMWQGTVDALAVDLYDHEAAAPVLDSADFYADCRALLTDTGCMTVNLFGRASSFERSLQSMAAAWTPLT